MKPRKLITLAMLASGWALAQTPVTFLEPHNFGNGTAQAIVIADFNGDGKPDAATLGNQLSVYLNNGNGSFTALPPIGLSGTSIVAADFNGDGVADLAIATSNGLIVLPGNGNGRFGTPVLYPGLAHVIATGDFNGDGIADIAAFGVPPGNSNAQVQVFFGSATGALQPGPVTILQTEVPSSVVSADFNRDGHTDLALSDETYPYTDQVAVLLGNGDGTFAAPNIYPAAGSSVIITLVTADFNGDGAPDLAYTDGNSVGVLLNNGTGGFAAANTLKLQVASNALAAADLNGDGIPDLLAAGDSVAAVLIGKGDGTFRGSGQYVLAYAANAIALADFNGDGIPDVASANGNSTQSTLPPPQPSFTVMLGAGNARFHSSRAFSAGEWVTGMAVGDFNHDGNLDVAVSNYDQSPAAPSVIAVLLGDGKGGLTRQVDYPAVKPTGVTVSDVNGDGNPDLVYVGHNCVGTLAGKGDGTFAPAVNSPCPDCANSILVGDFNGDGKPDIATFSFNHGVAILLGNGDGTFQPAKIYGIANATSIAAADFNHDGHLDLVISFFGAERGTYILMGNGDGTFGAASLLNAESVFAATGDFNGDGKPDLALELANGDGVAIYLGNGDGTFTPAFTLNAAVSYPLLAGDFNGDGITDLLGAAVLPGGSTETGLAAVLLGNGKGNFAVENRQFLMGPGNWVYAAAGDFNNDGHPDLATVGGGNTVWVILNTTH